MPPEQQTQIDSTSRRSSLATRRESILSRRESLLSRRESLITSQNGGVPEEGKISENGTCAEEVQVDKEAEIPPEPEPEPLSPEEEKRLREEEEQLRKKIAIEMRKAELRAKMEEASKARRAKKGFMTPERKKKLRLLLRKKAAEELRKEQERKANERRWIIEERCGEPEDLEWASKDDLMDICEDYFQRIIEIESDKWDLEFEIRKQTLEIAELTQKVSDLRGKFQRPILKKVSKYENKFAKLQRKAAEYNFRSQLKIVRRPDYKPKEDDKKGHGDKSAEENENAENEEDTEEPKEYSAGGEAEGEETTSLKGEEGDETPTKLEVDIETIEGGAEVEDYIKAIYTGRVNSVKSPRLEGEPRLEEDSSVEGGAVPKGEVTEGGQSPESQGEVQPSELTESTEPPPPPQPEHSPDDLWDYLKDAVTGEHPATVEEFVQKLIGTLEHVPEEYLKPVIDYNIKRANSPSVTDEEHLDAKEGDHHIEDENREVDQTGSGEVRPDDNCEIRVGHTSSLPEGEAAVRKADGFHSGDTAAPHDDVTNITENPSEEPSESTEGYPPLEAAA